MDGVSLIKPDGYRAFSGDFCIGDASPDWAHGLIGGGALRSRAPGTGLGAGTASVYGPWAGAFATRIRELGWSDGSIMTIQYRWAEGRSERFAAIAAEFVRLKVAVIVANGNATVAATKEATSDIPIAFPIANDPLGAGLMASLHARRQRNGNVDPRKRYGR
jgi:hypothetical protein